MLKLFKKIKDFFDQPNQMELIEQRFYVMKILFLKELLLNKLKNMRQFHYNKNNVC